MDELISRQAAIDYFVTNVGFHDEDGYPIEDTDELRKIWTEYFSGIPSAEPHWIPCSEGLPKEEGFYLVTLEDKCGAETTIRFFRIENGERQWSLWGNENITAWMPLPEPMRLENK